MMEGRYLMAISPVSIPNIQVLATAHSIIECESSGNHDVWGDLDYEYPAYGIAQFQERTFYWMAELSGRNGLDWKSEADQRWLLEWAIANGYGNYWTCFNES